MRILSNSLKFRDERVTESRNGTAVVPINCWLRSDLFATPYQKPGGSLLQKKTGGSKTLIPTRSSQRIDLIFSTTSLTYYIYIQLISGRCHVYIDADSSMQCEHNLKVAGKVSCGGGTYPPEFELSTRHLCSYFLKLF